MRVHINQLSEGCILSKDVFSISPKPLMRRQTILDQDLLQILRAFLIDEVDVEPYLENGNAIKPEGENKMLLSVKKQQK